jgi:hypothetical protein
MKHGLFLVVAMFAAASTVASAQINTGDTGGTQEQQSAPAPATSAPSVPSAPEPESTGGVNDDYSGAGAAADTMATPPSPATIKRFDVCLDRAFNDLKRRNYLTANRQLNTCLAQDGDPLTEDPAGVVPDPKLAEAYYARGMARAHLAHLAGAKSGPGDSASDFKKAEDLDPSVDARMMKRGFPRRH